MKSIVSRLINSRQLFQRLGNSDGRRCKGNWQSLSQLVKEMHPQLQHRTFSSDSSTVPEREESHGAYEMKDPESEDQVVNIFITNKDGKEYKIRGKIGDNLLYLAKRYEVEMEGACEASLACTTCHVYVEGDFYDAFDPPSEKEEDLLDMAPFLKENSRLGCQLILQEKHRGLRVRLPSATKNFYVDGHKPSHH